jgi:hypothetical protein
MTYIVTFEKINDKLETETWHDQRPTHREVPALLVKASRLEQVAWERLNEFRDAVDRGEYGDDYLSAAYLDESARVYHDYMIANERYLIIRSGQTCDCQDTGCRICNAYFYVTNAQEAE